MTLHLWQDPASRVAVFFIRGALVETHARSLLAQAQERVSSGSRRLVIDLRKVSALDSAGIGALLSISRRVDQAGGELVLVAPSPAAARGLGTMSLEDFFRTAPGVREALAGARGLADDETVRRWEQGLDGDARLRRLAE